MSSSAPDAGRYSAPGSGPRRGALSGPSGEAGNTSWTIAPRSSAGRWTAVLLIVAGTLAACGSAATSSPTTSAAEPTGWRAAAVFTTPPDTGHIIEPVSANPTGLAAHGYVEQEYFASGTAYSFTGRSTPSDGKWTIAVAGSAPYRTRIIVRRPSDPAKFDGNVVVEWMNVSAGESAPDWDYLDPALMDSGAAYVGVSAQALAVDGGKAILRSGTSPGLRQQEPARYGSLNHPGDQYSLDMFAQIGQALRAPAPSVLGGLRPSHVVAIGESQSAFYLTTYADAIQPLDHAYQGIFIHSRGGGAATFDGQDVTSAIDGDVRIRTDLDVPVFMLETQTDLIQLGYAAAQQPNTSRIRTWEVAGTSHADAYELGVGCRLPRLHHPGQLGTPARGGPGRIRRLPALGGRRDAAARTEAVLPDLHQPARAGRGRPRERGRRCPDPGRRRAGVDVERCAAAGQQRTLRPVRVDRAVRSADSGGALRITGRLRRGIHDRPRPGHRRRLHPPRRPGLAPGAGGPGVVPLLSRATRRHRRACAWRRSWGIPG